MGILKHFVLPLFCIYHLATIGIALTGGKEGLAEAAGFPELGSLCEKVETFLRKFLQRFSFVSSFEDRPKYRFSFFEFYF